MTRIGEAIKVTPKQFRGPRCSVFALLESLPKNEREALEQALSQDQRGQISATALSIAISSAYGINVHRASLDRHRRQECLCSRRAAR